MREVIAMVLLGAVLVPVPATAAEDAGRYQMEKSSDGYVRMDTATGRMSICRERDERLVCAPAADGRGARDGEVELLRRRVDALESRIAALEGDGSKAGEPGLPSEEEFEQSLDFMDRFFRRFMGIVKDFEKDEGETATPEAPPRTDRT